MDAFSVRVDQLREIRHDDPERKASEPGME